MDIDGVDWSALEGIEQGVYEAESESKEFYGKPLNVYNPEVHLDCWFDGAANLEQLEYKVRDLLELIEEFRAAGWELAEPVNMEATITTKWIAEGKPPVEYSAFGPDGYDLEGNQIDEWIREHEESEE